jgi:hypothetical protein
MRTVLAALDTSARCPTRPLVGPCSHRSSAVCPRTAGRTMSGCDAVSEAVQRALPPWTTAESPPRGRTRPRPGAGARDYRPWCRAVVGATMGGPGR